MKYFLFTFFTFLSFTIFASCSSDNTKPVEVDMDISTDILDVPQQGQDVTFTVKCNVDWTLSGTTDWCSASPTSGNGGTTTTVNVSIAANQTGADRDNILYISAANRTYTVIVNQLMSLVVDKTMYTVKPEGETIEVQLNSLGTPTVTSNANWITYIPYKREEQLSESFSIVPNVTGSKRTGTVSFALKGSEITISFEQEPAAVPAADATGMSSDAMTLAGKMIVGWNLGNSLESGGGETAWQNPLTTQELLAVVKAAGFDAVRIPCNWFNGYVEDNESCKIKPTWLARVKEVVDYCVGRDMYAILNIHYDGGWLEINPTYDMQEEVNRKQYLLWKQIADYFRDYDERLLFAGTNEVHIEGVYDNSRVTSENIAVQESFNQTFINAVRITGGRNAYRNLIVQSYNTNPDLALNKLTLPTDVIDNRIMLEVHCYDPWDYSGDIKFRYWGQPYADFGIPSFAQEDYFDALYGELKTKFVNNGTPIVLGEYGANRHSTTNQNMINSRAYYLEYVTRAAKKNGMVPFVWDNGGMGNGQDQFGLIERRKLEVYDQPAIDAIMRGAKE